ncbi:cytochrome c [Bradyrhizobium sp. dw_78]|uniref:c-type cytochrome n=1 Tax=Bradyrhizobium sp. dw_78 TaxID=2719793 RepID=UPI001BD1BD8C|nr:cytochrome c [Bradyrhizobium sp. dw_78]
MLNAFCLTILVVLSATLAFWAMRAWRSKHRLLKWGGGSLAGLAAAAFALPAVLIVAGLYKLQARHAPVPDLKIAMTSEQIHHGQTIASAFCGACHSSAGILTGGRNLGEHLPVPIGRMIAANLTPAGQLSRWSDGEIFRAIRNGVDADGHRLIIMSLTNAGKLSDDDIRALIAYIRSVPAAGEPTPNPPDQINPLGLVMVGAGLFPAGRPVFTGTVTAPSKAATAEYGAYILSYQDCRTCHGANLTGGVPGQFGPLGPNLAVVEDWKLEEFITTLRTGVDPNGYKLDGSLMPWRAIGKMDDEELGAIYAYLKHLPDSPHVAAP